MKVVTAHARQHACVVEERRVNQSIVRQKTSSNKSGTKTRGAVATRTVVVARPYCRLTQLGDCQHERPKWRFSEQSLSSAFGASDASFCVAEAGAS